MKNELIAEQYEERFLLLERFAERLETFFRDLLIQQSISFHAVEVRAKTLDSFIEKINRSGKTYQDPLSEITDQVGVRIILHYPSDVLAVNQQLRNELEVDELASVDKSFELDDDQFGYSSIHLICKLAANRKNLPEWNSYAKLFFEVQLRTVLQHAWASISHALQYKSELEVPRKFKRRLHRLAGLLELTDAEFMSLRDERLHASAKSAEKISIYDFGVDIDALSLAEYFSVSKVVINLIENVRSAGLWISSVVEMRPILNVCQLLKMSQITDLENELKKYEMNFSDFFKRLFKELTAGEVRFASGDAGHWVTVFLIGANGQGINTANLVQLGLWSEDYGSKVYAAAEKIRWDINP